MAQNKSNLGLGSYNPASGFLIQNKRVGYDDPILSGGASTITGSSMPDSILNKIRQAAGMPRVDRKVGVPTQETDSTIIQKIRDTGIGSIFATDPVLAARMEAANAPVSPFQESDEAFDLSPLEPDIFSPDSSGGISGALSALTGKTDMPGMETFGGTIPEGAGTPTKNNSGDITSVADDLAAMAGAEAREADETSPMTLMAEAEAQEDDEAATAAFSAEKSKQESYVSPFDAALKEAMKSYEDTKSGGDTEEKDLDYYKNEFAKATGIDVSGKVDKSQALMAFGLALMQNKAGKGFDVGKMLSSVGEAGEKAQPLLAQAKSEARAAQLAGGKYALGEIAKDEAAKKSTITAALQRVQDLQDKTLDAQTARDLEKLKGRLKSEQERIKGLASLRKAQIENSSVDLYTDKTKSISLFKDAPDVFKIDAFIENANVQGKVPVKITAASQAGLAAQFKSSEKALNRAEDELEELTKIVSQDGISTQDQIASYVQSLGRGFGLNVEGQLDPVAKAKIALERIATQQAPKILGEAGKTISDADRERVERIVGKIELLDGADPQVILQKLESVYSLIVKSGRDNLDTAYDKLHSMGYDYGPFAQNENQQQTTQPSTGGFVPNDKQSKVLGKYGL